jgi:hypothetical protein
MWAFRALFGGRGELMKQGLTGDVLHVYDLSSAYPAQIAELPSMQGGKWVHRKNPTREEIEQSNMLSMFGAETNNFNYFLLFYPLPFRVKSGAIAFPADVRRLGCVTTSWGLQIFRQILFARQAFPRGPWRLQARDPGDRGPLLRPGHG